MPEEKQDKKERIYRIKTSAFEGPFGLLLNLVEERKLFINDVSLAEVTEDYLKYIRTLDKEKETNRDEISSFIIVAATLILIKSKSLMPTLDLTDEEEGDIKDLEERLRLYEMFNKLGLNIKDTFGQKIIFAPLPRKKDVLIFLPDERITKESMMTMARDVLGKMPKKMVLQEVGVRKVISIEEMINKLTDRIKDSLKINFKEFAGKSASREEKVFVIVSFLAMLELVRQGILDAVQENSSDDIIIERQELIEEKMI